MRDVKVEAVKFPCRITGLDLFKDAIKLQKRIGKDRHGAAVSATLDHIESQMKQGVAFFDMKRKVELNGRAEVLGALYRDHAIGRQQGGGVRGRAS